MAISISRNFQSDIIKTFEKKIKMNLSLLVIAWLVHANLVFSHSSTDVEVDMTKMLDVSEKMLSSVSRSLSIPWNRQKRDLAAKLSLIDDSGSYRVISIKPVARLCYPAIRTLFLDVSNTTYAICITASTMDTPAELLIGYYKDHTWTVVHRLIFNNAVDAAAYYFNGYIYFLVVDNEKSFGPELMKMNPQTNVIVSDHEVNAHYGTSIAVWTMKNGNLNLAIANSNGYKDAEDLSSEVFIYEWKSTYFDKSEALSAYDVKDIEHFHIYGVAYIAIANFRRGKSTLRVDSEVFRFDQDKGKWMSHQKITTYGAMDWEFFSLGTSLGQEFFLTVANKGHGESMAKSMVYKFVEDKFVPFQCLPTTRATSISSFSKDGLFILAVANENDAVHLYQYDGWRFVKCGVQSTRGAMADGAQNVEFHGQNLNLDGHNPALIMSVSNPRHPYYASVYEVTFAHENLLAEWNSKSVDWCLNTLSKLESTDLGKTLDLTDAVFTDQSSITINGDVIFENGFFADSLRTSKFRDLSTEEVFDEHLLNKLTSLQERIDNVKQKLLNFTNILENSMTVEGNETILSNLEFQDAFFSCKEHGCHFENINTEFLNGERIADWGNRVVFMDREQYINGTIMAREISAQSMEVTGFVDGVKSVNLVTKHGDYPITGHKTFIEPINTQHIEVSGRVDGVQISPSNILLATGHQVIPGNKRFESLSTSWLKAQNVNGKNLVNFLNDLVLTGKSYEILGQKTFEDVTVNALAMAPGSTINGVDVVDLWKKALWVDGFQDVQAQMTFSTVAFKNLDVLGINGIEIPSSRIVDVTEPGKFEASQVFQNSTFIRNLHVLKSLNGISVLRSPDGSSQLDIILKRGDQRITGTKVFHTIHLDADSNVKGLVDGVDLSEFKSSVLHKNTSIVTNGTWIFENLSINGPLTVEGMISNVDLREVYKKAVKLTDSVLPKITFQADVYVENLHSGSINDMDIRRDFILMNESQTITGKKTFANVILEGSSLILGLVNNLNFNFNEVLLKIGNQRIKSKHFNRNVVIQNLTVKDTINNVPVADIVSLEGGTIFGPRILDGITFTYVEAKNTEVTGNVNSIDIKEMISDTMTKDGHQEVTGMKKVKGTIHIVNNTNFQVLNGINLKAIRDDAVMTDVEGEISEAVTFEENVSFNNFSFKGMLDGVSDWEIRNWMLRHEFQVAEGNTQFLNGFTARDLNCNLVNNLNLKHLESSIVKVNEICEIHSHVIFEKSVVSTGNVTVSGKVQGIDLSEEAVLKGELSVSGQKTFAQDLLVKDIDLHGLINDVNVEDLCNKTFLKNDDINVQRLVVKGDVIIKEGTIGGNLAGVDLSQIEDAAVRNVSTIKFSGLKTFRNITFDGPVVIKGKIGKVDLNELEQNYMSVSKNQEVFSKVTFNNAKFEGALSVTSLNTTNMEVNNINLPKLNDRILKTYGTQNVTATYYVDEVHFENDVFVAGKVNGHGLPNGLMRRNSTNYIESPKIFQQPVTVLGDLDMESGKTIQGVDISEWLRTAVFKEGTFFINGYKIFNELNLQDVKVMGVFDGLKISDQNLLLTYNDQVITGRKIVHGNVYVGGSLVVNGLINFINITDLVNTTVRRNFTYTISGLKYFTQPLTTISLRAPTIAGVDIVELQRKMNASMDLSNLESRLDETEGVISHMQAALNSQAVIFQYYELFDEFSMPSVSNAFYVYGPDCGELLLLGGYDFGMKIMGFERTTSIFAPARQELPSHATAVKSLVLNSTLLFVANRDPGFRCLGNSSLAEATIDIYKWNVDSFLKLKSLETNKVIDVIVFKDGSNACLVVLEEDSKVYCSENGLNWTVEEVLDTKLGQKVSILDSDETIMAIVAEEISYTQRSWEGQRYVDIYIWNAAKKKFLTPVQVIKTAFTQYVLLMKCIEGTSEEVFLAIAEGSMPNINNKPKILIYRYMHSELFKKYQEIEDYGALEWLLLKTGELLLFVVDFVHGQVNIYQYKGVSGFAKIDAVKSIGVTKAHAFIRPDPEHWMNHHLALAGHNTATTQPVQDQYYVKVLKAKVKGKRLFNLL